MESPPSLSRMELNGLCVQAEGFPPEFEAERVAECCYHVTEVPVVRVAPAEGSADSIWILQLESYDDRRKYLKRKKLEVKDDDDSRYEITLSFPQLNLIPSSEDPAWTSVSSTELEQSFVAIDNVSSANISFIVRDDDFPVLSEASGKSKLPTEPPAEEADLSLYVLSFPQETGSQVKAHFTGTNPSAQYAEDAHDFLDSSCNYEEDDDCYPIMSTSFKPSARDTSSPIPFSYPSGFHERTAEDASNSRGRSAQISRGSLFPGSQQDPGHYQPDYSSTQCDRAGPQRSHSSTSASMYSDQTSTRPDAWSFTSCYGEKKPLGQGVGPARQRDVETVPKSAGKWPQQDLSLPEVSQEQHDLEPQDETQRQEAPRTVEVLVGQTMENKTTYQYYFENERIGGGDVEDIEVDKEKGIIRVTFVSPGVALRVSERTHSISGRQVQVKLYIPPKPKPTYPDKLLFQNVADITTKDSLRYFVENVTGGMEPVEMLYGDRPGMVLVTFGRESDFAKVKARCEKRSLEGRQITVSQVPISNCVLVENLSPNCTQDTVLYYFLSKRSNGGEVERVEIEAVGKDSCRCYVYFEDYQVVERVLATPHVIDEREVQVKLYMECLGPSGGTPDPKVFPLPDPLVLNDADRYAVAFIRKFQAFEDILSQQLSVVHAQVSINDNVLTVTCTLQPDTPRGRTLAKTWCEDVRRVAKTFLQQLEVCRIDVMEHVRPDVQKAVAEAALPGKDKALLQQLPEQNTLVVVGEKAVASELHKQISHLVKEIEEAVERKKQEITDTRVVKPSHVLLLHAVSFVGEMQEKFPDVKVSFDLQQKIATFVGQLNDVKQAQLNMLERLSSAVSLRIPDLSETQQRLLGTKETKEFVEEKFNAGGILVVLETNGQEDVFVHAFKDKDAEAAIKTIHSSVGQHVCDLSPESVKVLQTPSWQTLKKDLEARHPGKLLITTAQDGRQITLTANVDVMHGTVEDLQRFLQENTIYSTTVNFPKNRRKFISQFRKHEVSGICDRLRAYSVDISVTKSGDEISVKGTSQGLQQAKASLQELDSQTMCHEETISDTTQVQYLASDKSAKDLDMLGRSHQCVISLHPDTPDPQHQATGLMGLTSEAGADGKIHTNVKLPSGVTLAAIQGDITQMKVDAIVNAANDRMEHGGGLAKVIVDKGGYGIQEECRQIIKKRGGRVKEGEVLVSGPGKLPCKAIIHAVGPVYKGGHSDEADCLETTVINCLDEAGSARFTSIALPAISTGVFRYPAAAATKVIVRAVKKYFEVNRRSSVHTVYLAHNQADQLQNFCTAIHTIFPSAATRGAVSRQEGFENVSLSQEFSGASSFSSRFDQPGDDPARIKPMDDSTRPKRKNGTPPGKGNAAFLSGSAGSIKILIQTGEIAKQKVDVIVNSVAQNLLLKNGAVSVSVLAAAGANLQTECDNKYPNGINIGDIARTGGAKLLCTEVFHIALPQWSPPAEQLLIKVLNVCLDAASQSGYTTIAFPVLGTGNLQYPRDVAARSMLGAIHQFSQTTASSSLREVRIIVFYKDQSTLQVFQNVQAQTGVSISSASILMGPARHKRNFESEACASGRTSALSSGGGAEFDVQGLRLVIKPGDITQEEVDVIVNSSNGDLDLNRGGVASALRDKCGQKLVAECAKKVDDMQKHGFVWTEAYNLKSRLILHVNAEDFTVDADWEKGIKDCLTAANGRGVQTLAMPALGTGMYAMNPDMSATFLYKAVKKFCSGKPNKLQEVRVVLFDSKMVPAFINAINATVEKDRGGILNTLKGLVGMSQDVVQIFRQGASLPREVKLYIYASSVEDIRACVRAFKDFVKDRFTRQYITDNTLQIIGPDEVDRIKRIGQRHNVVVTFDGQQEGLVLAGLQNMVPAAMTEINVLLRSAMLASLVQWYYIEVEMVGTKQIPYGPKENQIIEDAFQNDKKFAQIQDADGHIYVIDFNSMKESQTDDQSAPDVDVIRKMKMKGADGGELPPSWGSMQKDDPLMLVQLKTSDAEYKDVETNFNNTIGNAPVKVIAVDRVQNPTLFRQYSALKAQMTRQNPGVNNNERTLWHGTSGDARDNINHYGFNRSYCGKNAVQYGQGVYFAVQSNYSASATYSPPDSTGKRYMYMCKVLVGYSTQGNASLRVLPLRQGHVQYDSATDKAQNPWMYVIFNDTQAYPEYLVTFK